MKTRPKVLDDVERFDARIQAIPTDKFFTKRNVIFAFVLVVGLLVFLLWEVRNITLSTNDEVKGENAALLRENTHLRTENAELEDVVQQATAAIIGLSEQIVELGGTPPTIVLKPTTTTTEKQD